MAVADVVRLAKQIAAALTGTVHGELWPSAILVSSDAVEIFPPSGVERSRYAQYASPEVILGKRATAPSDVFSLGAILFHALAGRPPFRGATPAEVMLAICSEEPVGLKELRSDASAEIASIFRRCLARDPAERFASVSQVAVALEAATTRGTWTGRRILLADDDAPIRDLYAQIAARVGVDADVVATGRDAVAALKTRHYDLALLDLNMPRVSGWEVLDFLRTRRDMCPRRIFIVTGFSDQLMSEADREMVTAVIYKPVNTEELSSLVTECLRGGAVDVPSILRKTSHRPIAAA